MASRSGAIAGRTPRSVVAAALVCLAAFSLCAAPARTANVSPLIDAFRLRIAEVEQIDDPFGAGFAALAGASLVDMAMVDFIVAASAPINSRYVHDYDQKFVLSAVRGQPYEELESHLPAAMNYVRLATASRFYFYRIQRQELLWGEQRGLETLASIAQRAADFRTQQVAMIQAREANPARVLTAENLGELGDPALLAELEETYADARAQFHNQRNAVVGLVFLFQLGISFGVAVLFLQRRKPRVLIKL